MEENKMLEKDFKQIVENIKSEIYKTQTLIMSDANKRLIDLYFLLKNPLYLEIQLSLQYLNFL